MTTTLHEQQPPPRIPFEPSAACGCGIYEECSPSALVMSMQVRRKRNDYIVSNEIISHLERRSVVPKTKTNQFNCTYRKTMGRILRRPLSEYRAITARVRAPIEK